MKRCLGEERLVVKTMLSTGGDLNVNRSISTEDIQQDEISLNAFYSKLVKKFET
jgi:hypothetical protein